MSVSERKQRIMDSENLNKLIEIARQIRICMLTTLQSDGLLKSRPMYLTEINEDGILWFFNNEDGCSANEIKMNPMVNISFADLKEQKYLSISGHAEILHDRKMMEKMMGNVVKSWFPKGLDDESLSLLKIDILKAEYWESDSSRLSLLFNLAKDKISRDQEELHKGSILR